jgi:hypothetical protein
MRRLSKYAYAHMGGAVNTSIAQTAQDLGFAQSAPERINKLQAEIEHHQTAMVERACDIGDIFIAEQRRLDEEAPGTFMKWADENCPAISRATRNRYMQAARKRHLLPDYSRVSNGSLNGFLKFTGKPEPKLAPRVAPLPRREPAPEPPAGTCGDDGLTAGEEASLLVDGMGMALMLFQVMHGEDESDTAKGINRVLDFVVPMLTTLSEDGKFEVIKALMLHYDREKIAEKFPEWSGGAA